MYVCVDVSNTARIRCWYLKAERVSEDESYLFMFSVNKRHCRRLEVASIQGRFSPMLTSPHSASRMTCNIKSRSVLPYQEDSRQGVRCDTGSRKPQVWDDCLQSLL